MLDSEYFTSINLLKELELARNALNNKMSDTSSIIPIVTICEPEHTESVNGGMDNLVDWEVEEQSDPDDFTLVP